ncbi:LysR substrate-binding domain-containing protein [Hylemonella gracilis]|uniref:LysR family transcriptional regulator n=1 Tax=Hylemonella gracilis ATCC 19624 TaxID=887062 RepID=F3KVM7_9BURK|nr:LysR family transcriptional regulator [Hylemonella gracilis]EGI76166.1 LysR family transcriptional regulator [Hylemonella gracilis ATCC 19624]
MQLDLDLLRTFTSVVDTGGFGSAGLRVHRSQSTVSQQVRKLEELTGKTLLLRDRNGVTLTDDGELLLAYARRLLALHEEATNALGEQTPTHVLRVGVVEDFAGTAWMHTLADFVRQRPAVRLETVCDLSMHLQRQYARGQLDLIVAKDVVPPGMHSPIALPADCEVVWSEPLRWIAAENYPPPEAQTASLPLVLFMPGCVYRQAAIQSLELGGRAWHAVLSTQSLHGLQAALRAGMGLSPLNAAAAHLHSGSPGRGTNLDAELVVLDENRHGLPPLGHSRYLLRLARPGTAAEDDLQLLAQLVRQQVLRWHAQHSAPTAALAA